MPNNAVEKTFSYEEFARLLDAAAKHLLAQCEREYCDPPPPHRYFFVLKPNLDSEPRPPGDLMDAGAAAVHLVQPTGAFRDWVNMEPIGTCRGITVLRLRYSDRFTTRLLCGHLAFAFEPLELRGPSLPPEWQDGQPIPKVALPELTIDACAG